MYTDRWTICREVWQCIASALCSCTRISRPRRPSLRFVDADGPSCSCERPRNTASKNGKQQHHHTHLAHCEGRLLECSMCGRSESFGVVEGREVESQQVSVCRRLAFWARINRRRKRRPGKWGEQTALTSTRGRTSVAVHGSDALQGHPKHASSSRPDAFERTAAGRSSQQQPTLRNTAATEELARLLLKQLIPYSQFDPVQHEWNTWPS